MVYLKEPNREKVIETGSKDGISFAAVGMQGWRINMEDSHIANLEFAPDCSIFGVFDGHGGVEVAQFCKRNLESKLKELQTFQDKNWEQALIDSFLKMDEILESDEGKNAMQEIAKQFPKQKSALEQAIMQVTNPNAEGTTDDKNDKPLSAEQLDGKGCTAVVVLMFKDVLYCANAGDSRAVLAQNGVAKDLSEDHKPALEREKARIHKAGSTITPEGRVDGNLNLSRSIGDLRYKKNKSLKPEEHPVTAYPEVEKVERADDQDFIVIACDGIWETKTS